MVGAAVAAAAVVPCTARTTGALTPLGLPGDTVFPVERLVVAGVNALAVPEHADLPIQATEVSLENGGVLSHRPATATQAFNLLIRAATLSCDAASRIDVSGKGYLIGRTEGNVQAGGA